MSSKIPPLLEPYLALPPEASLVLLTSVLGASTNWLVLRFLHSALASPEDEDTKVVFVSFMRDLAFWKEGSKRLGFDLEKLAVKKRFAFVDGLSGLFVPKQQMSSIGRVGEKVLNDPKLEHVSREILESIGNLKGSQEADGKIVLVIDQLDLFLAAAGQNFGAVNLADMLMDWREVLLQKPHFTKTFTEWKQEVHSTVVTLSADFPLVSAQQTPLERNHAVLLLSLAHQADFTMGLRLLDTGTARDVSGVVRITVGDQAMEDENDVQRRIEERELLYFVGADGGVRVFERGQ
ncbi:hypothetical protein LSUE1_G007580 [Lachnellula suecica]|uniref:Elongator complex protein 6 n=1 Tax=Lachnellula suecica TaxID=602035 RepID=A0A8T9BY11_9HELO|nr:hypothetical protein LSUE1_G007580 [Lachnellula suecica]